MDIYENIFIGNFIYVLGVQIGIRLRENDNKLPTCINLLQQTPADLPLGDLFASFPGVSFLIEFKREMNKDPKEKRKHTILSNAVDNELTKISRSAHWFIQTKASTNSDFESKVVPYLDMDKLNQLVGIKSFDSFIKEIVTNVFDSENSKNLRGVGVNATEMSAYLRFLGKLYDKKGMKSSSLIMNVSSDGGLTYVIVNDIARVLTKHKRVVIEYKQSVNNCDIER